MHKYSIKKLPKSTVEIIVDIPWTQIKKEYDLAFVRIQSELTIEGFRKGRAPAAVAEKHIQKDRVFEELIRTLFPTIYKEIIEKEALKPIVNPKVELVRAKENEDWQIKIIISEKPKIELGDYKAKVKKIKGEQQKGEIWTPGKDKTPDDEKKKQDGQNKLLNSILSMLLADIKIEIPAAIVEEELNRRLTQLVDEVQKIGLTTEAYLKSKNLTIEELKARYTREIEETYKLEFILLELADEEKISVDKSDLEKLFTSVKSAEERKQIEANAYFYASVLRKQKTLDFLMSL